MYRIFLVEDDGVIAAAIKKHLDSWGYETVMAEDFESIDAQFAACNPHLVLLDVYLPFFNGYYWCDRIRRVSKVPIIFISSASDDMNIVMAMNMGGDDFISKPFDLSVLSAKVSAMLRRTYDFSAQTALLEHDGAVLDTENASLTVGGERVELTRNEYRIMQTLMENRGRVVTRETLMTRLWESDSFVDENTLTVNVTRLRKKLAAAGLEDYIATRKGVGYIVE